MKIAKLFVFVLLVPLMGIAQEIKIDKDGFETFAYQEGDSTYVMKKYFLAFLKRGDNRSHSEEEAARIQTAHLAHMDKLAKEGKINIAGPFGDDGDIRGIVIYSVPTLEEAKKLTQNDPAVVAGRLKIEVHPWWAAKGSTLN